MACDTAADCPNELAPCLACGPTSYVCAKPTCESGFCTFAPADCSQASDCHILDVHTANDCALLLGYYWNGLGCTGLIGCSCEGAECDQLTQSPSECINAHSTCVPQTLPCVGKTCGDSCVPCPQGSSCEVDTAQYQCNAQGQCTSAAVCSECTIPADCPAPPCTQCWDLSEVCPVVSCNNGVCSIEPGPNCPAFNKCAPTPIYVWSDTGCNEKSFGWAWNGSQCYEVKSCYCENCELLYSDSVACDNKHLVCTGHCETDDDCPDISCELCPDGTTACATGVCVPPAECQYQDNPCFFANPCDPFLPTLTNPPGCTPISQGWWYSSQTGQCTELVGCECNTCIFNTQPSELECIQAHELCCGPNRPCFGVCQDCLDGSVQCANGTCDNFWCTPPVLCQ